MSETPQTEEKIVEQVKEVKSKFPKLAKWLIGIVIAIIMAAIGFFGGLFGLSSEQQDSIRQTITGSAIYKEAVTDVTTDETVAVTEEVKEKVEEKTE